MAGRRPVVGVSNSLAAPQHPGDAQVFVEFGPMNAHRHQLEAPARRGAGIPQPPVANDPIPVIAGLDRQSILFARFFLKLMDARIKSGHDG